MTFWLLFFGLATVGEGALAYFAHQGGDTKDLALSTAFGIAFLICTIVEAVRLYG